MSVPSAHDLLNRSTPYSQKASKAFRAMFDGIKNKVKNLLDDESRAKGTELDDLFHDIPDTHSVAIVASHKGYARRGNKSWSIPGA